ncbi:MAG: hypothetical protein GXP42_04895 [Chloroflexi bacterium]|nr:hypothetical protein [Chloroflexota bacterium]
MLRESDLRELVEFDGRGNPVLSLYLNVDPRHVSVDRYKLKLRHLFEDAHDVDPADRARVERFFDLEYDRQARGVACFSCQKQGFWRAFTFNVPVENAIMVDRRPLVRRLVDLLETYGYLGVVAIDRQGARFFSFHLGSLEEAAGELGEDVKRHKQGGWAASRYQRHEDEAALRNLRRVAELTETYTRQYGWRRLVLAGADDNLAAFQHMLSPEMRRLVVGTTPLDPNASIQQVRERAETVALEARQDYQRRLAADLVVAAGKGAGAALGLNPTLDALQSGRVYQLLFTEKYETPNGLVRRCTACDYLSTEAANGCPICGRATEPLPDAVNTIARRAIAQGAQVIILPPSNPLNEQGENIGAFLRY